MADIATQPSDIATGRPAAGRAKFIIGGVVMLAAVIYLIVSNLGTQQYFMTVNELVTRRDELTGRNLRISGVVLGDTIQYDGHELRFTIAHVPDSAAEVEDEGGLAEVLHRAANDTTTQRVEVVLYDEPKPDLLQHEAQAIVTGELGKDGVFYADELLLKCPTKYEEDVPAQVQAEG